MIDVAVVGPPEMDDLEVEAILQQALDPNLEYFDATPFMMACAHRMKAQQARIDRLEADIQRAAAVLERVTNAAAATAQRQVEMRSELLRAGAFERKSPIIMPGDRR